MIEFCFNNDFDNIIIVEQMMLIMIHHLISNEKREGDNMNSKWIKPEIAELEINQTQYDWTLRGADGGAWGDGQISGHGSYDGKDHTRVTPAPTVVPTVEPAEAVNYISSAC
ncbi:hypothetical protein [Butyrivibrio sp.]|uniref:hypothetical protein n=1 Tax=Butyrivibrio sp. TaxID=28121 RepID=UPI0025B90501|nr:hypothetical protein [Butyrivibrio sp.]MBQ9304349.1 hypothetical protein [Butyrivibrio sp.]